MVESLSYLLRNFVKSIIFWATENEEFRIENLWICFKTEYLILTSSNLPGSSFQ